MRGDRPCSWYFLCKNYVFTPHARGSTRAGVLRAELRPVYPACAGIDLELKEPLDFPQRLPRMRGDRPVW